MQYAPWAALQAMILLFAVLLMCFDLGDIVLPYLDKFFVLVCIT
jgi:hypothetical protein